MKPKDVKVLIDTPFSRCWDIESDAMVIMLYPGEEAEILYVDWLTPQRGVDFSVSIFPKQLNFKEEDLELALVELKEIAASRNFNEIWIVRVGGK